MLALLVPVVAILLDTVMRAFNARAGNPIVSRIRSTANVFILEPFTSMFPDQTYLQTAAVALAGYGVITLLVVALFRVLRMATKPRSAPKSAPPSPVRRPAGADAAPTGTAAPADKPETASATDETVPPPSATEPATPPKQTLPKD